MSILCGLALLSLASQDTARIRALLDIEDSRPRNIAALSPLIEAASSSDTLLARWAVRGLGRQQRPDLIPVLARLLPNARLQLVPELINAIGQSGVREGAADARRVLEQYIPTQQFPDGIGASLAVLGRLPFAGPDEVNRTEALILSAAAGNPNPMIVSYATLALGSLYRRTAQSQPPSQEAIDRLTRWSTRSQPEVNRSTAIAALVASGKADSGTLLNAIRDGNREIRRTAALAAFAYPALAGRERVVDAAWKDADPGVRYEAVRAFGRHLAQKETCEPLMAALADPDLHIRLLATDLLGACGPMVAWKLDSLARGPVTGTAWHLPAHALVSLARSDSSKVAEVLPRFARSKVPWARMYAARAAEAVGDIALLRRLARDSVSNVRTAALEGLHRRVGHAADSLYIAALASRDYQVLLAAAQALDSSPDLRAVSALARAFTRVTAERKETSRDPRMAMLASIEHIGPEPVMSTLRAAASDFDSTVAMTAARMARVEPSPRPLKRSPVPSWAELDRWSRTVAVFAMRNGGIVKMRLRPFDAPTNVARFVRMARSGWFNRLTWHRVVPNFVVQGGSPTANEYVGDGPFTRDELGMEHHVRGTVGISTRGRDTGDGQLFINLIDNWRLDHDYTIIGEIVAGMDVVDAMQEGAIIQRVTLISGKP
jgi:cyclophilin family peptidyl-prolyl cis-trans isomerase